MVDYMNSPLVSVFQIVIALGIYNVWLLRPNQATAWRGGDAKTLEEEFHVYGLSTSFMRVVKVLKLSCATFLLTGLFYPPATILGAFGLAVLMLSAVLMHMKVHDPLRKSIPAATLLILSLAVALQNVVG